MSKFVILNLSKFSIVMSGVFVLTAAGGCNSNTGEESADNTATIPTTLVENLAKADKLDGNEDKVIHRCYSCALSMDGKSDYSATVNGYTVHFCTEKCCENFVENAEQVVSDTEIPEIKNPEEESGDQKKG